MAEPPKQTPPRLAARLASHLERVHRLDLGVQALEGHVAEVGLVPEVGGRPRQAVDVLQHLLLLLVPAGCPVRADKCIHNCSG